jgi:hypothetical protein
MTMQPCEKSISVNLPLTKENLLAQLPQVIVYIAMQNLMVAAAFVIAGAGMTGTWNKKRVNDNEADTNLYTD